MINQSVNTYNKPINNINQSVKMIGQLRNIVPNQTKVTDSVIPSVPEVQPQQIIKNIQSMPTTANQRVTVVLRSNQNIPSIRPVPVNIINRQIANVPITTSKSIYSTSNLNQNYLQNNLHTI
jgi:hypothetical protein